MIEAVRSRKERDGEVPGRPREGRKGGGRNAGAEGEPV